MTMPTMKLRLEYLSKIPAGVPDGRVLVHNVRPTRRGGSRGFLPLGSRGFRAWLAEPSDRLAVCGCDWAPELGEHYRVKRGG